MSKGAVIARFLLGTLLSCGLLAGLLYPCLPFGAKDADGNFLSRVYENATAGDLVEKTQSIWGWVLLALVLVAAAGLLSCPVKILPSKNGKYAGARLFFPAFCGTFVLLGIEVVLASPSLLAGFLDFLRSFNDLSAGFCCGNIPPHLQLAVFIEKISLIAGSIFGSKKNDTHIQRR